MSLFDRKRKFKYAKDIQAYEAGNHPVRHNTVIHAHKLNEDLAKQIYHAELGRDKPGYENLTVRFLRQRATRAIKDPEFIENFIFKDPDPNIGYEALKNLKTSNFFDLLKKVSEGDYPQPLRDMCLGKMKRLKNSIRYILE